MTFWDRNPVGFQRPTAHEIANKMNSEVLNGSLPNREPVVLDEEAFAQIQEEQPAFEEDEEDISLVMSDANLRLEMGRLYQMLLKHDLFGETDADPRAIRNVQREIRKLVVDKMELMLGIRQKQPESAPIVSSPFNSMEVTVLKMLASRMSKGATEETEKTDSVSPPQQKKDGITAVSGTLRQNSVPTMVPVTNRPVVKQQKPVQKQSVTKSALAKEESFLKKPISEMTAQELAAHDKAAADRAARQYAALPTNLVPHPTPAQLEMLYTQSASNLSISNPWRITPS